MMKLSLILGIVAILSGCATISIPDMKQSGELQNIYNLAKNKHSNSPWNIKNLYNPKDDSIFLPYQLWTGMNWDGNKSASCMHKATSYFSVNGSSDTTITGPHDWQGNKVWYREKTDGSKQQYFICNSKGIGRVYDSRYPSRVYLTGRCKFPAGYGWKIGIKRDCTATSIKITKMEFNSNYDLSAIEFEWITNGYHDHTYRYETFYGMRNAWKQ